MPARRVRLRLCQRRDCLALCIVQLRWDDDFDGNEQVTLLCPVMKPASPNSKRLPRTGPGRKSQRHRLTKRGISDLRAERGLGKRNWHRKCEIDAASPEK